MRRWRRWATAAVVALLGGALYAYREDLAEALRRAGDLSAGSAGLLIVVFVLGSIAKGAVAAAITPGLSLAQGTLVQQATTAANNTVIGGGPVSTGLRIAMLLSWGVGRASIGVTIVALNLVAAYAVWIVALGTAIVGMSGAADGVVDRPVFAVVIAAAVVVLGGATALWWVLLRRPRATWWIAHRAQRVLVRTRRRFTRLPHLDLVHLAEITRAEGHRLVQSAGARIAASSLLDQAISVITPLVVVRAVGITEAELATAEVLAAYGLVRLAAALSPVPGGLGVTELGLATLLTEFGGPRPSVLTAVLIYRTLTFVLPIVTGGVCFAWWRWTIRHRPARDLVRADDRQAELSPTP